MILKNKVLSSMLTTLRKFSSFKIYLDHNFNNSFEISEQLMKSDESFYIKKICFTMTFNSLSYGKKIIKIDKTFDENFTDSKRNHSIVLMSSAITYLCHVVKKIKIKFRSSNFLCGNFQLKSFKKKDNFNVSIFDFNLEKPILILKYPNLKLAFLFQYYSFNFKL